MRTVNIPLPKITKAMESSHMNKWPVSCTVPCVYFLRTPPQYAPSISMWVTTTLYFCVYNESCDKCITLFALDHKYVSLSVETQKKSF
ncbi:hypothetical protein Plhal304r1_c022g0077741 [Plasmopara halstedii]